MLDVLARFANKRYALIYIIVAFAAFTAVWFRTQPTQAPASTSRTSTPGSAPGGIATEAFMPDRSNVNPQTHSQLEALRMRVVESPNDTTHLYRLARLLQDGHKPDEAARHYMNYLALHPNNRQVWLDLMQCLGEVARWDEALEAANDMLERYEDDPSGLYNKGAILANSGRIGEARAVWTQVAEASGDPDVAVLARQSLNKLPPANG